MKITPFIKPIKIEGGTFYTCLSAQEDINYTFENSTKKFRFSKFVLLKIPPLKSLRLTTQELLSDSYKPNYVQLDSILGASRVYDSLNLPNIQNNNVFAESFQNYYYNLETLLTSNDNYSIDEQRTVSERVFFKWLKEIGAIRFRVANDSEVVNNIGVRYVEEDNSYDTSGNPIYDRVIKYIGDINIINSIKNPLNSFTEIYMHIPSSHGCTPYVLLNSISDNNYHPNMKLASKNAQIDDDYIEGRHYNDIHPAGLNIMAHYDIKEYDGQLFKNCWYLNKSTGQFEGYNSGLNANFKWWGDYNSHINKTYCLEDNFGNPINEIFAIGHDNTSDPNDVTDYNNTKFIRNKLDGISIDFNSNDYKKIVSNANLTDINDFNASEYSSNFSFNTVLLYYDVYDETNPDDYTTNLFGVLFLDNVDYQPGIGGEIKSYNKYKVNNILQQNGNSYAFRLNIKFDVNANDSAIEVSINDYNTFSLQLYTDALSQMKLLTNNLNNYLAEYRKLNNEIEHIKTLLYTQYDNSDLLERIENIENDIANSQDVFLNSTHIIDLINKNYEEIKNIYENKTSINMAYNIDVIKAGDGIEINKVNNSIYVNNIVSDFNIDDNSLVSITNDFHINNNYYTYYYKLKKYNNYIRIMDGSYNNPFAIDRDIILYIDDTINSWERGQKLRISFENGLSLNNTNGVFMFYIYTDSTDKLNTGYIYNKSVGIISPDIFSNNSKPIIEIICVDNANLDFVIDVF